MKKLLLFLLIAFSVSSMANEEQSSNCGENFIFSEEEQKCIPLTVSTPTDCTAGHQGGRNYNGKDGDNIGGDVADQNQPEAISQ